MPAMLSFNREWGTSTVGKSARCALRIRVNMSEIGSVISSYFKFSEVYQLALVTPGIRPARAASRKVRREQPNLRRYAWRRPVMEQRFTTRVGLAFLGSLERAA